MSETLSLRERLTEVDLTAPMYRGELYAAIEREAARVDQEGYGFRCAILFGSLAYGVPRVSAEDSTILQSDADILVLVNHTEAGGVHCSRKIEFGTGVSGGRQLQNFSEHIPKAEVYIYSVSAMIGYFAEIAKRCAEAAEPSPYRVPLFLPATAFLDALSRGIVVKGRIPNELLSGLRETKKLVRDCAYTTNEPPMMFER